jgi:lysyl oxidase/WD40 repeat protein
VRRLPLVLAAAVFATIGGQSGGATAPEQLVFVRDGDLWSAAPDGTRPERLTRSTASESDPALAPDGRTIAFAGNRSGENEIYRADTDEWDARPLSRNPGRDDTAPAWSPDGHHLAWTSDGDVFAMNAAGNARRPVATTALDERDPTWSPDGRDIAYAAGGDLFVRRGDAAPRQLTGGSENDTDPDWSRRGELAFVRDGAIYIVAAAGGAPRPLTTGPYDSSPGWSPSGRRLVFVRARAGGSDLLVIGADGAGVGRVVPGGSDPDWGVGRTQPPPEAKPPPRPDELLPDLDQRAPSGLTLSARGTRFKIGFVSAVDNVGQGPVWIVASRRSTATPIMRATQLVELRGGGRRAYRGAGIVRYTWSPEHSHWHYLRFETYELRRGGDFALVVRDHKTGFCLADHYGLAAGRVRVARARFLGSCARGRPDARRVEQGSSVGYTDRYPANYHGQNVDVTGVAAGTYWLVHRANPSGAIHERTLDNNNAAVLIRLRWPRGARHTPSVNVLRICQGAERCAAPTVP